MFSPQPENSIFPEFCPQPVELATDKIRLVPLTLAHLEEFYEAGRESSLWTWSLPNRCQSLATARDWIEYSMAQCNQGQHIPFAIIDRASGQLVGSTRYLSIRPEDRGLEIGFTFITTAFQRTYVNTHAKYCLLKHAFEKLGAIRVEFKTHSQNSKSRAAIARIGGQFEGVMRYQRILSDGSYRDTALFSVIDSEWPQVRKSLESRLL